ncbi:MAG: hypothetical protein WA854_09800 [Candidatus Binataceae bacterium]
MEHATHASDSAVGAARESADPRKPLPSLIRYSPALVVIAIAIADAVRIADPDLWGHVRFGEIAIRQGHLLLRDSFSYSAPGHIFQDHEWLTDVVTATAYDTLGIFGLKLLKLLFTGAAILMVALADGETGAPELAQFAILIAVAALSAPYYQFRPQTFTFTLFAAVMLILTREAYGRRVRLWVLLPIFVVWANLHGGFIMGLAALGTCAAVGGAQDLAAGRGSARLVRLGAITVGSTLATLLTPYGIGIWMAIAHALANPFTRVAVADWQPLISSTIRAFHTGTGAALYGMLPVAIMIIFAVAWFIAPDGADLPIVAVAGLMSIAAFMSQRNIPIALIALAPALARHGWLARLRLRGEQDATAPAAPSTPEPALIQTVGYAVAIALFAGTGMFSRRLATTEPYPAGAVAFMQSHGLHGDVLNNFLWGDYLIWHLAPESKVFIDGRYDTVYPQPVLRDFMLFHFDQPGGAAILSEYPHDFVMISPKSEAVNIMSARADWKLVYRDSATLLYARSGSRAASLPGVPVTAQAPPSTFP